MKTHLRSRWLVYVWLAIVLVGSFLPRAYGAQEKRDLFCREDGYCLPPPMELGEFLAQQEAGEVEPLDLPAPLECEVALLVKRTEDVSPEAFRALLERQGYTQIEGLLVPQWWRVCSQEVAAAADEIQALAALPQVADAEQEGISTFTFVPNDTYYPLQWGLPKVQAPQAWDLTRGSTQILISIVDSGLDYTHPDGPVLGSLYLGYDFANGDSDPFDDVGHGTHVTGIATAAGNNGIGISGLCPLCATMVVKVGGPGGILSAAAAEGIAYAAFWADSLGKRSVINLSFAGPSYSSIQADAVAYALNMGSVVIAAAGNDGPGLPSYPAALPGVAAITATDSGDWPTSFSQWGNLAAPGYDILSTVPPYVSPYLQYWYKNGTSMSAPLVSAAAGLVWSRYPGYTPNQVVLALLNNADVPAGWNSLYGTGRLNVYRAVSMGAPVTPTPTRTPTPGPSPTPRPTSAPGLPKRFLPTILR